MIVGQDWGGIRYFKENAGLDKLNNPTIKTLQRLLDSIGFKVSLASYQSGDSGLFLTNAVLCLKDGDLQAGVQKRWFTNCGHHFLRHQIEIVAPTVVVTLGQRAYEATVDAFGFEVEPFRTAVENSRGVILANGSALVPVYHCGNRILNTHRPLVTQIKDWNRVKRALADE